MVVALCGGLLALNWILGRDALAGVAPDPARMRPSSTLAFLFIGSALWLLLPEQAGALARAGGRALAALTIILGTVALAQHLLGVDLRLEWWLSGGHAAARSVPPSSAIGFLLLGTALLLLDVERHGVRPAQWLAIAAGLLGMMTAVGYVYGVGFLYGPQAYTRMTVSTALLLVVAATGILFARPGVGLMTIAASETTGGMLLRRLLPTAVLLPLFLGWLRLIGLRAGLFSLEYSLSLFALTISALFVALVTWAASLLHQKDRERRQLDRERNEALNHAREARAQSEAATARFRGLFETAPDGIVLVNREGRITLANPRVEQMLGYEPEELIGRLVEDVVPDGLQAAHVDKRNAFFEAPRLLPMGAGLTLSARRKDGSTLPVEISLSPLETAEGTQVTAILRDVTERARAEQALRESEERLQAILDNAPPVIYMKDTEGRYLLVNRQFETLFGVDRTQVRGKSDQEIFPQEFAVRFRANDQEVLEADAPEEFEERAPQADGMHTYISVKFPLRDANGKTYAVCGISTDITERRRMEEELRTSRATFEGILKGAPDPILIVDAEGRITLMNDQAEQAFGYRRDELIGQKVEVLVPEQYRQIHVAHRADYMAAPRTRPMGIGLDLRAVRKDGSVFPVEISLSPMHTPAGVLVTTVVRDITTRKQAEEEIRALNRQLERQVAELDAVNKELEAFSYSVSHDLRAPLRGIDGFSQALLEDYGDKIDAVGQDYLRRVRAASQRMAQLIDDLLKLSRATRGEMRVEPVDLSAMARDVAGELRQSQPERAVEFAIADGVRAEGDPRLLRVVLENLLGNAWKFTSKRERARIEFGQMQQDGETVYYIRDNGAGFDMAFAAQLFRPFQRLHGPTEFPGTGIGLATVQRIVHRHGGRVWAEGEVDKGATVYFTL